MISMITNWCFKDVQLYYVNPRPCRCSVDYLSGCLVKKTWGFSVLVKRLQRLRLGSSGEAFAADDSDLSFAPPWILTSMASLHFFVPSFGFNMNLTDLQCLSEVRLTWKIRPCCGCYKLLSFDQVLYSWLPVLRSVLSCLHLLWFEPFPSFRSLLYQTHDAFVGLCGIITSSWSLKNIDVCYLPRKRLSVWVECFHRLRWISVAWKVL